MTRSALASSIERAPNIQPAEELREAFARFSDASRQLEDRYSALRTEAEQLRTRLRQKDEEIERQTRLAMLGETAAALAHEVRNPLGALTLFLSLLREEVQGRTQAGELVSHMERTITSLNHVVENILQFAKDNRSVFTPVNVHALLGEQRAVVSGHPSAALRFEERLDAQPFVRGNEHALRHVFANLLTNAAEAMQWKGSISVTTSNDGDDFLRVEIGDTGPGVDPELLPRLFEPFVTGKSEGTGLGLAVVKKILGQHGAEIRIENAAAPRHGARVIVTLRRDGQAQPATLPSGTSVHIGRKHDVQR